MASFHNLDTLIQYSQNNGLRPTEIATRELNSLKDDQAIINTTAQNIFNATQNHLQVLFSNNPTLSPTNDQPLIFTYCLNTRAHSTHKCYQAYMERVGQICWPTETWEALPSCSSESAYRDLSKLGAVEILSNTNFLFLSNVATRLVSLFREISNEHTQTKFRIEIQPYDVRKLDGYTLKVIPNVKEQVRINSLRVFIYQQRESSIWDSLKPEPFSITVNEPKTWDDLRVGRDGKLETCHYTYNMFTDHCDGSNYYGTPLMTYITYGAQNLWSKASMAPARGNEEQVVDGL